MPSWFNPRVATLVGTVLLLLGVTRAVDPQVRLDRALPACAVLLAAYVAAFVWPLRQAVARNKLITMTATLACGWAAIAAALIADAAPVPPDVMQQTHPMNWSRLGFLAMAAVAFGFFFRQSVEGYDARDEFRVTGRRIH